MKQKFLNGFESWQETHFEVVSAISYISRSDEPYGLVNERHEAQGTGGLYELAKELTDKFEKMHEDKQWGVDAEYFEVIEEYLEEELKHKSKNL